MLVKKLRFKWIKVKEKTIKMLAKQTDKMLRYKQVKCSEIN